MTGTVFDIQHFCVDDGPGIRTTVFLKGCPLRCRWCHNPEGLKREIQISFHEEKCTLCERCAGVCQRGGHVLSKDGHILRREACVSCGECADKCPSEALKIMGKTMSAEEVIADVIKDQPFYENSGGGVTLSGGEPLYQSAFALEVMEKAKEAGLHVCLETSGFCSESVMLEAAKWVDLFLLDIKETDAQRHVQLTGVDNAPILRNARLLADMGKLVIFRCPVIPGCNDRTEHFLQVVCLAQEMGNICEIHLEPYHPFGVDKYDKLGMKAPYDNPDFMEKADAERFVRLMQEQTKISVRIS